MLVLSRKQGERLKIGEEVVVTIVRVSASRVELGIQAPSRIRIKREELPALPPDQRTDGPGSKAA